MLQTSTITLKGQITLPQAIRDEISLKPGMRVIFKLENKIIQIQAIPSFFDFHGSIKSKKPFNIKSMRRDAQKYLTRRYGKSR